MKRIAIINSILLAIVTVFYVGINLGEKTMGIDQSLTSLPQFDQLEVVRSGATSITIPSTGASSSNSISIAHSLGYTPICLAFVDDGTSTPDSYYKALPTYIGAILQSHPQITFNGWLEAECTRNYLLMTATVTTSGGVPSTSGTWNIKYYLCRAKATQ